MWEHASRHRPECESNGQPQKSGVGIPLPRSFVIFLLEPLYQLHPNEFNRGQGQRNYRCERDNKMLYLLEI
jgi:hypothetical protein